MGLNLTKIEWVKNPDGTQGYTWNPITGCLNHINGLCKGGGFPCYAYRLASGRLRERYLANVRVPPIKTDKPLILSEAAELQTRLNDPFYPRFWEERLFLPFNDRQISEKGIFVCDMSDLFGIGIPEKWTRAVLDVIEDCPTDRFYLLTKQPQNLIKFSPFPDNCWVGVTATNYIMANHARYYLGQIEAKVKYLSIEPFLEPLRDRRDCLFQIENVDWLIIGAQTKPMVYPKDEWVQEIEQAADNAGIPVFEKNNLYPSGFHHLLRQELPNVTR